MPALGSLCPAPTRSHANEYAAVPACANTRKARLRQSHELSTTAPSEWLQSLGCPVRSMTATIESPPDISAGRKKPGRCPTTAQLVIRATVSAEPPSWCCWLATRSDGTPSVRAIDTTGAMLTISVGRTAEFGVHPGGM